MIRGIPILVLLLMNFYVIFARLPISATCLHNIIAPQAIARVLPVFKGKAISLVKMISIVGYIAVQDMTKVSDMIRSRTFDVFFPLVLVAIMYLLLALAFTKLIDLSF